MYAPRISRRLQTFKWLAQIERECQKLAVRTYFKVKAYCESNPSLSKSFFLSGKTDQRIGDALYPHLSQHNVSILEIRTCNSKEEKPSTITEPDTPISVLESFGVRFIFVHIKQNGKNSDMSDIFVWILNDKMTNILTKNSVSRTR